jgi:hypothetical protein
MTNMSTFVHIPLNDVPLHPPPLRNPATGRVVLSEHANPSATAYAWSTKKKCIFLTIVALCQFSMNFNAAFYSNAVDGINSSFGIFNARLGMTAFLISYAIGCEL